MVFRTANDFTSVSEVRLNLVAKTDRGETWSIKTDRARLVKALMRELGSSAGFLISFTLVESFESYDS